MGAALRVGGTTAACTVLVVAWWWTGAHWDFGLRPIRTLAVPALGGVLLVGVFAYSARKHLLPHAHRVLPRPVDFYEREARAHQQIQDLQRALYNRATSPSRARRTAARIVRKSGLRFYYRPVFEAAERPGAAPRVRLVRRAWMGGLQGWLRLHMSLGVGVGVLFALHAGGAFRQPVGSLAEVLLIGVLLTGALGVAVFRWLPGLLTRLEGERVLEDVERVAWLLEQRVGQLADEPQAAAEVRVQLDRVHALERRLQRRRRWAEGWRVAHIVVAVACVVVLAVHGLSHWVY